MIGILVAVREELKPILKRMPSVTTDVAGGIVLYRGLIAGKHVAVARTGMGAFGSRKIVRLLAEKCGADRLLICGFAGGLIPAGKPGDLVVATGLMGTAPRLGARSLLDRDPTFIRAEAPADRLYCPSQDDLDRAKEIASQITGCHTGIIVSVGRVLTTTAEKRELVVHTPALVAADMESLYLFENAAETGLPCLVVRAITDGLADNMPVDFNRMTDWRTGKVSVRALAASVALRPWKIPGLLRLGRRSGLAARNLAEFVERYVAVM